MKIFSCLVLISLLFSPPKDIDVLVPPGTPLEWDKDLQQPVPTGGRSRVPTTGSTTDAKPKKGGIFRKGRSGGRAAAAAVDGGTVAAGTPLNFGITNLYQYFGVTTRDIMNHIDVKPPKYLPLASNDVATGGGSGVKWLYPPDMPIELVWIGVAGCMRAILHPELVSVPETTAYLCEVGEPTLVFALKKDKELKGPVGVRIEKLVTPLTKKAPPVLPGRSPLERMINRLAVFELTSGYPHALDPTYARHTLALGEDAYQAVLKATGANHQFLSRNAAAVLANFKNADAPKILLKLLNSPDPVIKYRALTGLGRKRYKPAVPTLIKGLLSNDDVWQASCAYTLGAIGDKKALKPLMKVGTIASQDLLWSILPAVARLTEPDDARVAKFFEAMRTRVRKFRPITPPPPPEKSMVPPDPEPLGTKLKVLIEMCRLGAAASGDPEATKIINDKFNADGIKGFFVPNHILVCNVFRLLKKGRDPLIKIVERADHDRVASQAFQDLQHLVAKTDWVIKQAESHKMSGVRAIALAELSGRGDKFFRPVAQKIIDGYSGGEDGGEAFVVGTAIQLMSKTAKGNNVDSLIRVVESALSSGAWARREGNNVPDITQANIRIMPPLLEIACIELGRTGDKKGIPVLIKVLTSKADSGRGEAALALAGSGDLSVAGNLIKALEHPKDGWLRFCAYRALKALTGKDHFVNWIFGSASTRRSAIARYRADLGEGVK